MIISYLAANHLSGVGSDVSSLIMNFHTETSRVSILHFHWVRFHMKGMWVA